MVITVTKGDLSKSHKKKLFSFWQLEGIFFPPPLKTSRHLGSIKLDRFDIEKYRFVGETIEQNVSVRPRMVNVAAIQHSIVRPTTDPILVQRAHIFAKVQEMIEAASELGANIVCLPETWSKWTFVFYLQQKRSFSTVRDQFVSFATDMPFGFCTRDMMPWCEFAEDCETGPSTTFVRQVCDGVRAEFCAFDLIATLNVHYSSWLSSIEWWSFRRFLSVIASMTTFYGIRPLCAPNAVKFSASSVKIIFRRAMARPHTTNTVQLDAMYSTQRLDESA